jgi:hypothetical protein
MMAWAAPAGALSQRFVAVENVYQEDATVLVQGVRHPDGQANGDYQIEQVGDDFDVHKRPPFRFERVQLWQDTASLAACQGTFLNTFRKEDQAKIVLILQLFRHSSTPLDQFSFK